MTIAYVKPDGIQSVDTFIGNTHQPIQDAIEYCYKHNGGVVFISDGTYSIDSSLFTKGISLYSNIALVGESHSTKLIASFSNDIDNDIAIISCIGNNNEILHDIKIQNLFIGNNEVMSWIGKFGIYCDNVGDTKFNCNGIMIENCIFKCNIRSAILLTNCSCCDISNSTFSENNNGIIGNNVNSINISNNTFISNLSDAISLTNINNTSISNNIIQSGEGNGINVNTLNNSIVSSNLIYNNVKNGIVIDNGNNLEIQTNIVRNNVLNGITLVNSNNVNNINNIVKNI